MTRRVVITGIGAITPIGHDPESTWEAILAGRSGMAPITLFDTTEFQTKIAAEVKDWDPTRWMSRKQARQMDRYQRFALASALQAVENAGLEVTDANRDRIGVIYGSAIGGVISFLELSKVYFDRGPAAITPFGIPRMMPNGGCAYISMALQVTGPVFGIASACATGTDNVGLAYHMIRGGVIDAAVAGGADATVSETAIGPFNQMQALTTRNDAPTETPRPFDRDRDGFAQGEGGAALVLETLEGAKARGANILAEIVGWGSSGDAFHISAPDPSGAGGARAMVRALNDAGINPEDVDYINAHGTATMLNDVAETRAIKTAFGDHAYKVIISSTKSMTAHPMGAAGALEAIFCTLALRDQVIPPTINLDNPDPECDLDYTPWKPREARLTYALSDSLGFGGHNASVILKRFS
ncbi:MAG: beta-ketoacyl-ACP synthase II [Anaerolineae bacterium]